MSNMIRFKTELPLNAAGKIVDEETPGAVMVPCNVEAEMTPYDPGRVNGDPSDCSPPSGGGIEEITVTRIDTGAEIDLTDSDYESLKEEAEEEAAKQDEGY